MTFTYVGKQRFIVEEPHGRQERKEDIGWLWQDYHQNRQLYVRPLGKGRFQLAIFVNGIRTTDEVSTQVKIQNYTMNNMGFPIDDSIFKAMV